MVSIREITCSICLATISENSFEIDEFTRAVLDIPFLNTKVEDGAKQVACSNCYKRLSAAVEFKSTCLNTNKTIISYTERFKMLEIDLKEVYVKEKESRSITGDQKVCWLCLELAAHQFKNVRDEELEAIHAFLPEFNTSIVKDPVICTTCFDSLCAHKNFIVKIGGVCAGQVMGDHSEAWPVIIPIKKEIPDEFETNGMDESVHIEDVKVKLENAEGSDVIKYESCEDRDAIENNSGLQKLVRAQTYNFDKCKKLSVTEIEESKPGGHAFKCNECGFETKEKRNLKRHIRNHRIDSEGRLFQCDECDYTSNRKTNFTRHQLKHKSPSEVQSYKCNDCDYETRYKSLIRTHVLVHLNLPEVWMHKCDECGYMTRKKSHLKSHQIKHKSRSEIQMYKCELCSYETKYKMGIARHQWLHQPQAEGSERVVPVRKRYSTACSKKYGDADVVPKSSVLRLSIAQKMKSILNVAE